MKHNHSSILTMITEPNPTNNSRKKSDTFIYSVLRHSVICNEDLVISYGILLQHISDNKIVSSSYLPDVSEKPEEALKYLELFSQNSVDPEMAPEIMEELIC